MKNVEYGLWNLTKFSRLRRTLGKKQCQSIEEFIQKIFSETPEPPESLTIDLSKSPMIDTAGIQLLIAMREFMRSKDREFKIHFNEDLEKKRT